MSHLEKRIIASVTNLTNETESQLKFRIRYEYSIRCSPIVFNLIFIFNPFLAKTNNKLAILFASHWSLSLSLHFTIYESTRWWICHYYQKKWTELSNTSCSLLPFQIIWFKSFYTSSQHSFLLRASLLMLIYCETQKYGVVKMVAFIFLI